MRRGGRRLRICTSAFLSLGLSLPLAAQLDESCFVSALNRTAPVQSDGTWVLPNVPAKSNSIRNSTAVEDYLERILELIQSKGYARVVDIASALKISQASVTNMVQRLGNEGLLKYEKYRGLVLTPSGEKLARNIANRHRLLTDFLQLLGLSRRVIHHDVEGMEHHISPPTLRAIAALTGVLRRQPALRARLKSVA